MGKNAKITICAVLCSLFLTLTILFPDFGGHVFAFLAGVFLFPVIKFIATE